MDSILGEVVSWGTGTRAAIPVRSAGKTGTTTDSRDLWYVGYTTDLVTAVWIGNSDGTPVTGSGAFGGSLAAPVWREYMSSLYYQGVLEQKPFRSPQVEPVEQEPEAPEETELPENPDDQDETETGEGEGIPEEELGDDILTPEPESEADLDEEEVIQLEHTPDADSIVNNY